MEEKRKHRIIIVNKGTYMVNHGENLGYFLASKNMIVLPCGGKGLCGLCKVYVKGKVSRPTGNEVVRGIKSTEGVRLACQTSVLGDAIVEILWKPVEKPRVPPRSLFIGVEKPRPLFNILTLEEISKLHTTLHLDNISLEEDKYYVVFFDQVISSFKNISKPWLLLIDLGTTKIEYEYIDLEGNIVGHGVVSNPLNRYGVDIISRLSRALSSMEARREMVASLQDVVKKLAEKNVIACLLAGNSVMESFFADLPVGSLAVKPFQPISRGPFIKYVSVDGRRIPCFLMPLISGFVGGDAFSNLVLTEYMKMPRPYMIIDLGANTEIILVTDTDSEPVVYTTSVPAGPAFEGYLSSSSVLAVDGITGVEISGFTGEGKPLFRYYGEPSGLTGSGVVSLVAELLRHRLVSRNGRFLRGYDVVHGVKAYRITRSASGDIIFTQKDLREFQKALAAVKTGWKILLKKARIEPSDIEVVVVSGRFGSSIKPSDAVYLRMVPVDCVEKVVVGGNTVLSGLYIVALDRVFFEKILHLVRKAIHVNLAEEEGFMEEWIKSLELESCSKE